MATPATEAERLAARKARARNRQKGRAFEKRVAAWLRGQGWIVDDMPRGKVLWVGPGRPISTPVDFFGCFDLLAYSPGSVWLIQCTDGGDVAAKRHKITEALKEPPLGSENRISVFEAQERRDDLNPRRKLRLARVHDWTPADGWVASHVVDLGEAPDA